MLKKIFARIKKADVQNATSATAELFYDFSTLEADELMREYERLTHMVTAAKAYNNGEFACRYCEKIRRDIRQEMQKRLDVETEDLGFIMDT